MRSIHYKCQHYAHTVYYRRISMTFLACQQNLLAGGLTTFMLTYSPGNCPVRSWDVPHETPRSRRVKIVEEEGIPDMDAR